MVRREAQIPIVLWVCAALLVHLGGGDQAERLATMHEDTAKLRAAVRELTAEEPAMELDLLAGLPPKDAPENAELPSTVPSKDEVAPEATTKPPEAEKKPPEPAPKVAEAKKPPEPPKKVEPKPEEPKKEAAIVPPEAAKPKEAVPLPPPPAEKKIAVQQHQKEDEAPNPNARFLAEKNHKVDPSEETHASITSLVENDPNPTPGTHQGPAAEKPGDGDKNIVAHDANRAGEKVAPNVVAKPPPVPPKAEDPQRADDKAKSQATPRANVAKAAQKEENGRGLAQPGGAATAAARRPGADVMTGAGGESIATGAGAGTVAAAPSASVVAGTGDGRPRTLPMLATPGGPKWVPGLGMGMRADAPPATPYLDEKTVRAAIGRDELDRLKKVEGETRLSMHRGSWRTSNLERWRRAIENYTPGVRPGNQTNLGTAAAPWATYLAQIHVRLHPIFADDFVEGLSSLPQTHPLNDQALITRMEIVLRPEGTLDHLGIVKPSGVTAFDVAALDAVDRAAPFGKAPQQIVSPDGLVYLHWEFHRDDQRCSNVNAYPYLLKEAPSKPPTPSSPEPKPLPPLPHEGKKYGFLTPFSTEPRSSQMLRFD